MPPLFYAAWYSAPLAKLAALFRWRQGVVQTYPGLALFVAFSALQAIVLALLGPRSHWYAVVYDKSAAPIEAFEALAIFGVFAVTTEHTPRIRKVGSIAMAVVAGGAMLGVWLTSVFGVPAGWSGANETALVLQRYSSTFLTGILCAARWLLPREGVRLSARRAADVLTIDSLTLMGWTGFTVATGGHYAVASYWAPVISGLLVSSLWLFWLTPASNECVQPKALTTRELEQYAETQRLMSDPYAEVMRAVARAMRSSTEPEKPQNW